jgi:hypothetical protein
MIYIAESMNWMVWMVWAACMNWMVWARAASRYGSGSDQIMRLRLHNIAFFYFSKKFFLENKTHFWNNFRKNLCFRYCENVTRFLRTFLPFFVSSKIFAKISLHFCENFHENQSFSFSRKFSRKYSQKSEFFAKRNSHDFGIFAKTEKCIFVSNLFVM